METIGERVRYLRKQKHFTLEELGSKLGVSGAALSLIESGKSNPSAQTVKSICREFNINEEWLRFGVGEAHAPISREQELAALFKTVMRDRPESFRSRLVTALLRFEPDTPEWELLERIYESVASQQTDEQKESPDA